MPEQQATPGKKRAKPATSPATMATAAAAIKPKSRGPRKKRAVAAPGGGAPFTGTLLTMAEHELRDQPAARFAAGMEAEHRSAQDVLAYCAKLKEEMPWYVSMQNFVAGSDGVYEYPDVPVLSHQVILTFLREPSAANGERPCVNLDREPQQPHEQGLVRCIAHRLSEAQLGPGKAFRLREMLFDEPKRADPPDLCYLCHLWTGLCDALRQRDKTAERARPDMTDAPPETVVLINRFMVMVDQVGEYDRNKMLVSDKAGLGIWGPFPLFNEQNYVAVERKAGTGPAHFDESPNLLFRLTPAVSPRIASSSQSIRNPSAPTREPLSNTGRPQ